MTRYFFHLRNGAGDLLDEQGRSLDGLDRAKETAVQEARGIVGKDAREGLLNLRQSIEVADESGAIVHSLQFRDAFSLVLP